MNFSLPGSALQRTGGHADYERHKGVTIDNEDEPGSFGSKFLPG
ncbi:MAG TPA: hypothetical protein VJ991_13270 [Balneolales bacterium]|nr:hypothetical protein [Balneolales bacterium]